MAWYAKTADEVLAELGTGRGGLSSERARELGSIHGPNALAAKKKVSPLKLFLGQFNNALIIVLIVATTISGYMGHTTEAVAIFVIVILAVILGFSQEYKAEKSLESLKKLTAPTARVLRDGVEVVLAASEVTIGDIMVLTAGDKVAADGRLVESANLNVNESSLTGESLPAEKDARLTIMEGAPLGDRRNMVFAQSAVTYGRGLAVATGIGQGTEFGKIANLMESVEDEKTPLQKNLDKVGGLFAKLGLLIVAVVVVVGYLRGESLVDMFIYGIALAVAVVPEALPAVVTISLALGVQRMVKRHALMRKLMAVETLGSTDVICSDKTGTLTRDQMTVREIHVAGVDVLVGGGGYEPEGELTLVDGSPAKSALLDELVLAGLLCNDAKHQLGEDGKWKILGDPTEGALIVLAKKAGIGMGGVVRLEEIPFSSETKYMLTLHHDGQSRYAVMKGAPEMVLPLCGFVSTSQGVRELTDELKEEVFAQALKMADKALRVLAIAKKPAQNLEEAQQGLTLLGLVGMIDPPRENAKAAVATCRSAGIRPVMITGDHPQTAKAIAREIGIYTGGEVVTGAELSAMGDVELHERIERIEVFARVSPEDKFRIVTALKDLGHIVAMTGDGVNDAPALKKADIGISMGIAGTDVAREASDMTLTDDNFASIVAAVEEGRRVFVNIQKFLAYVLSTNIGEIGLIAGAALFGLPLPINTVQILYINLATNGPPAIALGVDPPGDDLMRQKPKSKKKEVFSREVVTLMFAGGLWSSIMNFSMFYWVYQTTGNLPKAVTMTFALLLLSELVKAFNYKSFTGTAFKNAFDNKWLNIAAVVEAFILVPIVHLPLLQKVFGTTDLVGEEWLAVGLCSLTVIPVLETVKFVMRKTAKG